VGKKKSAAKSKTFRGPLLAMHPSSYASSTPQEHKEHAPHSIICAIVTVSDSKTESTDRGGPTIRTSLERAGHAVAWTRVVRDELLEIRAAVEAALQDRAVQAVVLTGGTGIARRDVTVEALEPILEKELPGFGEIFRALSFKEIGSAAMLSRAVAGIARGKPIFALPGSPQAVKLAMDELVVKELGHMVGLLAR
jgi:molybdenum cofactor biosynthesis protein B